MVHTIDDADSELLGIRQAASNYKTTRRSNNYAITPITPPNAIISNAILISPKSPDAPLLILCISPARNPPAIAPIIKPTQADRNGKQPTP
jgi:hypothetical protein